jgi:hypothetical protein
MERVELMMVEQSEERIFEKYSVPDFLFYFPGITNELAKLMVCSESWKKAHIVVNPAGRVLFDGKEVSSSN